MALYKLAFKSEMAIYNTILREIEKTNNTLYSGNLKDKR